MGELLSEVDLREISERCDQVETIIGPPGTQDSAEEWCYLLRSHEISPLCDEAQCDIRRLIAAYAELRARLESAEKERDAARGALREAVPVMQACRDYLWVADLSDGQPRNAWRNILSKLDIDRLDLWLEEARAALGAACERSEG